MNAIALESGLPHDLRDLLQRLRGTLPPGAEAIRDTPAFLWKRKKYGDFFQDSSTDERAAEVRLRVLGALGNCKTLTSVEVYNFSWKLSPSEWEAFLIPHSATSQYCVGTSRPRQYFACM